jgi:hypothetical protein
MELEYLLPCAQELARTEPYESNPHIQTLFNPT